jgi:hypothetical protein
MNIDELQEQVIDLTAQVKSFRDGIANLRTHLASEKFKGLASDGGRRDWIAIADVSRWLDCIELDAVDAKGAKPSAEVAP